MVYWKAEYYENGCLKSLEICGWFVDFKGKIDTPEQNKLKEAEE